MSTVKKSQASRPWAWARRNRRQDVSSPCGAGRYLRAQDPADCRLADLVAEAGQLAVHAAVSPRRVLGRQPQYQVADLLARPRAAGPVRVRPFPGDQAAVLGQQYSRRHEAGTAQRCRQQPG